MSWWLPYVIIALTGAACACADCCGDSKSKTERRILYVLALVFMFVQIIVLKSCVGPRP